MFLFISILTELIVLQRINPPNEHNICFKVVLLLSGNVYTFDLLNENKRRVHCNEKCKFQVTLLTYNKENRLKMTSVMLMEFGASASLADVTIMMVNHTLRCNNA